MASSHGSSELFLDFVTEGFLHLEDKVLPAPVTWTRQVREVGRDRRTGGVHFSSVIVGPPSAIASDKAHRRPELVLRKGRPGGF